MKRVYTAAFNLVVLFGILSAQNIIKEPFDYPAKDSIDGLGGWNSNKSSKQKIAVVSPGLTYGGYAGSGIGNAVRFSNKDNGDLCSKQLMKMDTGSVYLSYLINVDSLAAGATSGYNVAMDQFGGATNVNLRGYIQRVTDSTYTMGVTKFQSSAASTKIYKTKQTYLVVLRYQFAAGTLNDTAKIFVFSSGVPLTEPVKPDTFAAAGTDAADLGEIWLSNAFVQSGLKGSPVTIDEIRVGRSWSGTVLEPAISVLTEDFYFTPGDSLRGKNGWDVYYGGSPLFVDSLGLSYTAYHGSGLGKAMRITGGNGSQSLFRTFSSVQDTNVYCSFMTNFSGTNATQGFFFSLANLSSGNYRALVYAKIESGVLQFGLRPTLNGTLVFDTTKYVTGKTYLIVLKYTYVPGDNNDEVSMFVLGSGIPATEPNRPNVGPLLMPNDAIPIGSVVLNSGAFTSGGPLQGASILVDGIRVTKQQWRSGLTPVQQNIVGAIPSEFTLQQNYPNPFNPTTAISFTLSPNPSPTGRGAGVRAILKVFNSLGQEVATLVNEVKEPGSYTVYFDGSRLSSGVYFAALESGGQVQMKKMLMLK